MAWLEAGAGWPVILLHAFPLTADMWRPQLERTPAGWRFMAPDYMSVTAATMDDYASDVLELMNSLAIEDAVIGGLSMGGYVTFAMHRQEPDRFTGVILADTRPRPTRPRRARGA